MTVYLHDVPLPDAWRAFKNALEEAGLWELLGKEEIALDENSVGRALAEAVWAKSSSPHYHASAMDGFAVLSTVTHGASETNPRSLVVGENAIYVDTGDPLPDNFDSVIPVELVEALDDDGQPAAGVHRARVIRIRSSSIPWKHVRTMGEDIIATQLVLPEGHQLRPVDLGAIAASGHASISVARKPVIGILPTGTELVPIGSPIKPGDIIEFNSIILAAQIEQWGATAVRYPQVSDDFDQILRAVQLAVEKSDLVLLNAGSSAGSEDFSARVVETLGKLLVHGVAVRPGHPVILGILQAGDRSVPGKRAIPIIGVPGYPVSAALTGEIFVEPLIATWLGRKPAAPLEIDTTITRKVTSPAGDDDYLRVVVGKVDGHYKAAPLTGGAGVITSLVRADGITIIPRSIQGYETGSRVRVRLYRSLDEIEKTILVIGSHDMTLDILAQHLQKHERRLVSANAGSLGGLLALRRGEAHLAGSHLLDPLTGEFNKAYLQQYIPDLPVLLVTWAEREQGLMVRKGNPKRISSLSDLARKDVSYINRQRGAGTRILLDFHLEQDKISNDQITGYQHEEFSHLNVAVSIASGRADCGLGIAAAAAALNLDFIPLFTERYDFVIPCQYLDDGLLNPLFKVMQDKSFRGQINKLPGYHFDRMGEIVVSC